MQCTICGSVLQNTTSDLSFKTQRHTIVFLKNLPILECTNCGEFLITGREFSRVEEMLAQVHGVAELEIFGMWLRGICRNRPA